MLPETSAYVKGNDEKTKWMYFFKSSTIWHKVNPDIKKEFDSKTVYNIEFLKTKIKSQGHVASLSLINNF